MSKITEYYRVAQAAAATGVNRSTLISAVRSGACASESLADGLPVVTLAAVNAWLETERRPGRKRSNQ